jgi:protein-disulfide isomerase
LKLIPPVAFAALFLVAGCHAQQNPANASGKPASEDVQKRAVAAIRQKFEVPPDVNVTLGNETPADIPGYDNLPVTFQRGDRTTTVPFLISQDGKTLARFDKVDLTKVKTEEELAKDFLSKQPGLIAGRPYKGNPNAPVTIVNFDDFECPYCARMHQSLFPGVFDANKDKIKVVYVDYPLVSIHPWAMHAAVDANCLTSLSNGDYSSYWEFADRVHGNQQAVGGSHDINKANAELDRITQEIAGKHGIAEAKVKECIAKDDKTAIEKTMAAGDALGINSTPTLYINGAKLEGALPPSEVQRMIDEALKQSGSGK